VGRTLLHTCHDVASKLLTCSRMPILKVHDGISTLLKFFSAFATDYSHELTPKSLSRHFTGRPQKQRWIIHDHLRFVDLQGGNSCQRFSLYCAVVKAISEPWEDTLID